MDAGMMGTVMQGMGGAADTMGVLAGAALKGAAFASAANVGGQAVGELQGATTRANDQISEAYSDTNADLRKWWQKYYGSGAATPSAFSAQGSQFTGPVNIAQQTAERVSNEISGTQQFIKDQGALALSENVDDVATRLSGLSSGALQSVRESEASIDADVASGKLTPAAAASMKQQVKAATGSQLVDRSREFHADMANRTTGIIQQTAATYAGFTSSSLPSLLKAGEDVTEAYNTMSNMDRDLQVAVGQNRVNSAMGVLNNTTQYLGNTMQWGLSIADMLAGVGDTVAASQPGKGLEMAGAGLQQRYAAKQAQPDEGGMF